MKEQSKKITKEWVELTLCDMTDEIMQMMKSGKSKEEVLKKIKDYSLQIYDSQ